MTDYESLCIKLAALMDGVPHRTANLANASALIFETLEDLNWACIEIPLGRGVCGTAAREDKTQLVPDVHLFPGHIACDSASNSEIVVPLRVNGKVVGVLDLDSPWPGRFTEEDQTGLETVGEILSQMLTRC